MEDYILRRDGTGQDYVDVPLRGPALLNHPLYNKSTAFSESERRSFGLDGLLPRSASSMDQQVRRVCDNIRRKTDPLEQHIGLSALQDRNEILFYRVILEHLEEFLPIVYTPTVGAACQHYSRIFRRARGLWITPEDRGRIAEVLSNARYRDVRLIVVTDNERILGLGDQGCGGMGIPVGKLTIYTVAAGIHPTKTLPISLDVGTDNRELLDDELYLGWRQPRLRGPAYDELVEEFVCAVQSRFPHAVLQWEDFKKENAFRLLDRYHKRLPSFNDDIQGTAAVAVAAVAAASRAQGKKISENRVVILGAGAAGVGIARQLREAFQRQGLSGKALVESIAVLDSQGLVIEGLGTLEKHKRDFAWPKSLVTSFGLGHDSDLLAVVRALKPSVLIGTSGQPGVFDEAVVRAMAEACDRPTIMPLSNPTSKSEAKPEDIVRWTDGRALIATGSPFPAVEWKGRTIAVTQANNAYVFPSVGLGAMVAELREIPESLFAVAAEALGELISDSDLASGALFPPIARLREITEKLASAIVREARDMGYGRRISDEGIDKEVRDFMWQPRYPKMRPI